MRLGVHKEFLIGITGAGKGVGIMKGWIVLFFIASTLGGCTHNVCLPNSEASPQITSTIPEIQGDYEIKPESEIEVSEIPAYEWTEQEMELLSIDTDKITFFFESDGAYADHFPGLKAKYSDLELISTAEMGIGDRYEVWCSGSSGLSYGVYHFERLEIGDDYKAVSTGEWYSVVQAISGKADKLIEGLIAPINVADLMKSLGIEDNEWEIGEAPETDRFGGYYGKGSFEMVFDIDLNSLCIVIPLIPFPSWDAQAIGIKIDMANDGYVSPTDDFVVKRVGISV